MHTVSFKQPPIPCSFLTIGSRVFNKQAVGEVLPGDATQLDALRQVLGIGLTGLGVGGGVRSIQGLRDMFARIGAKPRRNPRAAVVSLNVPTTEGIDKQAGDEDAANPVELAARVGLGGLGSLIPSWPKGTTGDFLMGRMNATHTAKPWFLPLALGAAGGGLMGGYRAMDAGLDHLHKQDKDRELEDAKSEYRKALVEQYSADHPNIKTSSDSSLGADLHELYQLHKVGAFEKESLVDGLGTLLGAYGAGALLVGGGTAAATYNWAKSRSPEERLANAIKQRERLRWATRPPEIYAVAKSAPVRVSENPQNRFNKADDDEEETVRKIAKAKKVAAMYKV